METFKSLLFCTSNTRTNKYKQTVSNFGKPTSERENSEIKIFLIQKNKKINNGLRMEMYTYSIHKTNKLEDQVNSWQNENP